MTTRYAHHHPATAAERRRHRGYALVLRMLGLLFMTALLLMSLLPWDKARAAEPLVRFEDGIGSQPLRAGAQVNQVFGINPGGIPWVISRLSADVSTDGQVRVDGRGLLLAGGNTVATPGVPAQSVRARLICAGVFHDSELVQLDARGDFRIGGFLNPIPPSPCNQPVLLIINANGSWFAAGILKQ